MSKALVYGDNINTDVIIAGKYTKTLDFNDLAKHCMEDLDPAFSERLKPGDIVVGGENFGCGSSREQAPIALKYAGVGAVLAKSFARIFYRNAINVGLLVLVCDAGEDFSAQEYTVFEGVTLKGWPVKTMLRGKIVYENGAIVGAPNGEYLKRPCR